MSFVNFAGQGPLLPPYPPTIYAPTFSTSLLIDATGEKVAFLGKVWFPARSGTKDIQRLGFRFGTVVKASGSGLTVSLQDVSTSSGPPGQPDETPDQTVAIANGDASFASNTWIRTGTLSANRTVSCGDMLAVVIEFDGAGRLGSDSVQISSLTIAAGQQTPLIPGAVLKTGGAWAGVTILGNVVLEMSDGTFGILEQAWSWSAINTHSYNQATGGADEYAMAFQVPATMKVDGLWALVNSSGASADFDLVLYDGTTALASSSTEGNWTQASSTYRIIQVPIAEQTLTTGNTYYVSVKPTTNNSVTVVSYDVNTAAILDTQYGGQAFNFATRVDAGSWSATTTRRLLAGIRLSAIDNAAGGGAGVYNLAMQ